MQSRILSGRVFTLVFGYVMVATSLIAPSIYADSAVYSGKLSINGIQKFVKDHGITSPADLLSRLPEELRTNFTLIPDGHSLHAKLHCTDNKDPRLVVYSIKDRFVMAFTNKDSPTECRDPEMLEARPDGSTAFEYVSLANETPANHAKGIETCRSCHGVDPSPIWQSYPRWVGNYGSEDDFLPIGPGESDLYNENISHWRNDGIYHSLKWTSDPYYPYSTQRQSDFRLRPNFRLGLMLSRLEAKRIANRIFMHPSYPTKGRAFLSQHLGCTTSNFKYRKVKSDELSTFGLNPQDLKVGNDGYDNPTDLAVVALMQLEAKSRGASDMLSMLEPDNDGDYQEMTPIQEISSALKATKMSSEKKIGDFCRLLSLPAPVIPAAEVLQLDEAVNSTSDMAASPVRKCIVCHSEGSSGPHLPFGEAGFNQALHETGHKHGTLYDEIVYRVSEAKGDQRMPLGSSLEPTHELPNFLTWLSKMKDSK